MQNLILPLVLVIVLAIIIWFFTKDAKYYQAIFADRHYAEIYRWLRTMLDRGNVEISSFDDGSAIVTSGNLVVAYTRELSEEIDLIHISVSQGKRHTTQAVGGRILYLFLTILEDNTCAINVFRTQTSVHHIELTRDRQEAQNWHCHDLDFTLEKMRSPKLFPVRLMEI